MAANSLSLVQAANLLLERRKDILDGRLGNHLAKVSPKGKHIDVGITKKDNVLIITGSNGILDYMFYNLRPLRPLPDMEEIEQITSPELPKQAFHKGFLLHAARVKRFLGDHKPNFIVGHSLGAATAQILGTSMGVPTIGLASPQVVKRKYLKPDALRDSNHPQWNVFNVAWRKDFVTRGYRLTGLRSLGHRVVVDTDSWTFGIHHFVKDYQKLVVSAAAYKTEGLPLDWPDPNFAQPTRLA